jgi:hypothetical protein
VTRKTSELHVAGDLGYGVGAYRLVIRRPGEETGRDSGKYLLVYRRQADGTWKVAADVFSSDLPPAARPRLAICAPSSPQATRAAGVCSKHTAPTWCRR